MVAKSVKFESRFGWLQVLDLSFIKCVTLVKLFNICAYISPFL